MIMVAVVVSSVTSCKNAFEESAQKNTNEAVYFAAQRDLDASDFDSAITKLLTLSTAYKSRREVVATIASAYAGRCGLQFLTLVQLISDNPGSRLFPLLIQNFKNSTVSDIADCVEGERWLRTLAPTNVFTDLTSDENIMLAMLSFAKIGSALATYGDLDHDGVADATFDTCNVANLPDATAREIGTGITVAISAIAASGATIGAGALNAVATACSSLPAGQNFCSIYVPADFTAAQVKVINGLIASTDTVGLGTCNNTLMNCVCP